MTLRRAQTLMLYLLVWSALGTVFSADVFEWPLVLGVYGATLASLALPYGLRERWSKSRFVGVTLLVVLGSTILEILSGSRDIVSGATLFLVFVLVSRLFTPRTPADATTVLTLSLVVVLAGSALNTTFAFAPFFVLVVICSIWALTTTHLSRAAEAQPEQARNVRISRAFLLTTSLLGVVIFVQTTVFFVIFPRMGLGYFKPKVRTSGAGSGFSDRVQLGQQGTINDDASVVLRLEFPEGTQGVDVEEIYFRGATLTQFDGIAWRRTTSGYTALRQRADATFPTRVEPQSKGVRFTLYQEPGENEFLFVPEGTTAIRLLQDNPLFTGRPRVKFMTDDRGDLVVMRPMGMALPIEGWFDTKSVSDLGVPQESLALPEIDARVKAIAAEWRGGASTPKEIADAFRARLSDFTYSSDMVAPPQGRDPLSFFLADRKAGHCEYFASSLAVMLRLSGVPARVVNGYHGATYNKYGNYYAVAEYRAHSWTEYFDGTHWRRLDATPSAQSRDPEAVLERLSAFSDMMRFRWNRYVIEYDLDTQIGAVQSMRQMFKAEKPSSTSSFKLERRYLIGAAAIAFVLVAGWVLRRRGQPVSVEAPVHAASRYFRRLEKLAVKKGLPQRPLAQGPAGYIAALAAQAPALRPSLDAFSEAYLQVRFGPTGTEAKLRSALQNVASVLDSQHSVRNDRIAS